MAEDILFGKSDIFAPAADLGGLAATARPTGWGPTGALAATMDRSVARENVGIISSGRLQLFGGAILPRNTPVTNITFVSGTTALVTGTNQWFCIVDQNRNILAKTADDTSNAWAANASKTLAISGGPYTPTVDIPVWLGLMVAAATPPSVSGMGLQAGVVGLTPILAGNSTTGLTTPASLVTVNAPTTAAGNAYAYVS